MAKTYNHACVKCGSKYQDTDPDPYYCVNCQKVRKEIAAQVDVKFAKRPKIVTKSLLQEYEEAPKINGFLAAYKP